MRLNEIADENKSVGDMNSPAFQKKSNSGKIFKIISIFLVIVFLIISIYFILCYYDDREYDRKGQILIDKIENYRQAQGRLPNNYAEFGDQEPMNFGPYYEKNDSINYTIYFVFGFDNYRKYFSKYKKWENIP